MNNYTIQYYGASWCAPCKTIKPQVEELVRRFSVPLELIDYDKMDEEAKAEISKLPTIRVKMTKVVKVEFVTRHLEQLEAWLKSNVRVKPDDDF